MKAQKRILCFILTTCLLLVMLSGCNSQSEEDRLAQEFFYAFYTGDGTTVLNLVPPQTVNYLRKSAYSFRGIMEEVESFKITLIPKGKAAVSELKRIEKEYDSEAGIYLLIEQGFIYDCSYKYTEQDGKSRERDSAFDIVVGLVDGYWYAIPANL